MRPVAMMTPDLELIAEVMLASEGFREAKDLARKTITLYTLMTQQLSKQDHYDCACTFLVFWLLSLFKNESPCFLCRPYCFLEAPHTL